MEIEVSSIENQVRELIIEVLKLPADIMISSFDSDNIPAWDSMGHMQLIIKLESVFSCEFSRNNVPLITSEKAIVKELKALLLEQ